MIYPWQLTQWQRLWQLRQQRQLPHALLLTGMSGMGKQDFAEQLAQAVLCQVQQEQACGHCQSCKLWAAGSHPDYYLLTRQEKAKTIKIDQVRELAMALSQTAQCCGFQVALLADAETMNRAAANALLKTLEEPAGDVLIILVTNQMSRLPATIISRCQRISFIADWESSPTWLAQTANIEPSQAQALLTLADGAPLRALHFADADYMQLQQNYQLPKKDYIT